MIEEKEKTLLTEREAAHYFGWSVYTMREFRKRGEIDFIKFNQRTIRYTQEQLEDFKERHLSRAAKQEKGVEL